jgi:hypothetical protein
MYRNLRRSGKAGELAREVFCSRDPVLLSGLIVTLMWNNNVDRHCFLWPAELNAHRNETLFPAACVSRIDVHRRDVHMPPICMRGDASLHSSYAARQF